MDGALTEHESGSGTEEGIRGSRAVESDSNEKLYSPLLQCAVLTSYLNILRFFNYNGNNDSILCIQYAYSTLLPDAEYFTRERHDLPKRLSSMRK